MVRAGSFLARLLLIAGMFGVFFFLTQFLQKVMGFSPLRAGVAFLPMTIALFAASLHLLMSVIVFYTVMMMIGYVSYQWLTIIIMDIK